MDPLEFLGNFFDTILMDRQLSDKSTTIAKEIIKELENTPTDHPKWDQTLHRVIPASEELTAKELSEIGQFLKRHSTIDLVKVALHIEQTQPDHQILSSVYQKKPQELKDYLMQNIDHMSDDQIARIMRLLSKDDKLDIAMQLAKPDSIDKFFVVFREFDDEKFIALFEKLAPLQKWELAKAMIKHTPEILGLFIETRPFSEAEIEELWRFYANCRKTQIKDNPDFSEGHYCFFSDFILKEFPELIIFSDNYKDRESEIRALLPPQFQNLFNEDHLQVSGYIILACEGLTSEQINNLMPLFEEVIKTKNGFNLAQFAIEEVRKNPSFSLKNIPKEHIILGSMLQLLPLTNEERNLVAEYFLAGVLPDSLEKDLLNFFNKDNLSISEKLNVLKAIFNFDKGIPIQERVKQTAHNLELAKLFAEKDINKLKNINPERGLFASILDVYDIPLDQTVLKVDSAEIFNFLKLPKEFIKKFFKEPIENQQLILEFVKKNPGDHSHLPTLIEAIRTSPMYPQLLKYLLSNKLIFDRASFAFSKMGDKSLFVEMITLDRALAPGKIISSNFHSGIKERLKNLQYLRAVQKEGIGAIKESDYQLWGNFYLKFLDAIYFYPQLYGLNYSSLLTTLKSIKPPPSDIFLERIFAIAASGDNTDLAKLLDWIVANPSKGEAMVDFVYAASGNLKAALDLIQKCAADPTKWNPLMEKIGSHHAEEINKALRGEPFEPPKPPGKFSEILSLDPIQAKLEQIQKANLDPLDEKHALLHCLTFELSKLMLQEKRLLRMPNSEQLDKLFKLMKLDPKSDDAIHIKTRLEYLQKNRKLLAILLDAKMNADHSSRACQIVREMFDINDPLAAPTRQQAQIAILCAFLAPLRQELLVGSCSGTCWLIYLQLHPVLCERCLKNLAELLTENSLTRNMKLRHAGSLPFPLNIRFERKKGYLLLNPLLKAQENCLTDMSALDISKIYGINLAMFEVKDAKYSEQAKRSFFSACLQKIPAKSTIPETEILNVLKKTFIDLANGTFIFSASYGWVLKRRNSEEQIRDEAAFKKLLTEVITASIAQLKIKFKTAKDDLTLMQTQLIKEIEAASFPASHFIMPNSGGFLDEIISVDSERETTESPFLKPELELSPRYVMEFILRFCQAMPENEKDSFLENPERVHTVIYARTEGTSKIGHGFNIKPAQIIKSLREGNSVDSLLERYSTQSPMKMSSIIQVLSLRRFLNKYFPNQRKSQAECVKNNAEVEKMNLDEFGKWVRENADPILTDSQKLEMEKEFLSMLPDTEREKLAIQVVADTNWENPQGKYVYLGYGRSLLFQQPQFYQFSKDRKELLPSEYFSRPGDWSLLRG